MPAAWPRLSVQYKTIPPCGLFALPYFAPPPPRPSPQQTDDTSLPPSTCSSDSDDLSSQPSFTCLPTEMQQQVQFTPAMIFVDLAPQYPSPPSSTATDDCISAVLSSPAISNFDELSPYPAPPSTASTEGSMMHTALGSTLGPIASTSSLTATVTATAASAGLSVTIPSSAPAHFFDMAAQYPVPPLSAHTDASFGSLSTASPALPMYHPHMPLPASGCLYEAAALSQAISPQTAFPAQFAFRVPAPAYPALLPINTDQAFFSHGLPTPIGEHGYSSKPVSSFQFSCPSAPLADFPTPEPIDTRPMPQPAALSTFVSSALMPSSFGSAQIPTPEFLAHIPRSSPPQLQPHFAISPAPTLTSSLPQLPRTKPESTASPDLNLYDATEIRNSGMLFASNGRILLACRFCKLRKLRCNGGTPGCSQCTKRGLCCSYPTTIRRRGKAKRKADGSSTDGASVKDSHSAFGNEDELEREAEQRQCQQEQEQDLLKATSRSASEEPDLERSRKRKGTAFGSEPLLAPAYKKRSQSCHGTETATFITA